MSADGRYVIVLFEQPGTSPQSLDVWLLDLRSAAWLHAPGMPVYTDIKATDVTWSEDGRVVLLGRFSRFGDALVIWRPGEATLAVRPFALPDNGVGFLHAW